MKKLDFTKSKDRFRKLEKTQGFCNWEVSEGGFLLQSWMMKHPNKNVIEPHIVQFWPNGNGYQIYRPD